MQSSKLQPVITYGGVFSNVFSSHYWLRKMFENTPSVVLSGHKHCYVSLHAKSMKENETNNKHLRLAVSTVSKLMLFKA